jgi:hypothetical protein
MDQLSVQAPTHQVRNINIYPLNTKFITLITPFLKIFQVVLYVAALEPKVEIQA